MKRFFSFSLYYLGYDSDVAREKAIDYTTKIYAVSIREMEGTKPHHQIKEASVEERYIPVLIQGVGDLCITYK